MSEFRLTQISDTHLARRYQPLTDNFDRLRDYIDATSPDMVVNSGDLAFDGPTNRDDLEFAKTLHAALPVTCRTLPGNHDVGDNPTKVGPVPTHPATEERLQAYRALFGEDRWRFDAAGWCFIGLNSLVMNTGLASAAEQLDWLASELSGIGGKLLALFLHKPLYLNAPDDPELVAPHSATYRCRRAAASSRCSTPSICGWSPAATCTSGGFHFFPHPPRLGAFGRFRHFRCETGSDRSQGSGSRGIPLPARLLRSPSHQGAGPVRRRSGFAVRPGCEGPVSAKAGLTLYPVDAHHGRPCLVGDVRSTVKPLRRAEVRV